MPSGTTTTAQLADSLPSVIASARLVRDHEGVMVRLVENQELEEGTGLYWNEVSIAVVTAQAIEELTDLEDNPQQLSDTLFQIQPTMIGVATLLTERLQRRISEKAYAKLGQVAQRAIERKKDQDGLTILDSGTSLGGAGTTGYASLIVSATARIAGNVTEPVLPPFYTVLHPYQVYDLAAELTSGVGTYNVEGGLTEEVYRNYFRGKISDAEVFADGNISVDGSDDAKGGVFAKSSIVLVQGMSPKMKTEDKPGLGGGSTIVYHYDDYGYGIRHGAAVGLFEIYTDATAPAG